MHVIDTDHRAGDRSLLAIAASAAAELSLVLMYGVMIALTPVAVAAMALMRLGNPQRGRAAKEAIGAKPHPVTPPNSTN